jgi:pyruvyltransferase
MPTAYFWRDIPNYGDRLVPLLLARFANLDCPWASVDDADIVSVGSVLEHISDGWTGIVAGSGRLREGSNLALGSATVLGVRGPLSAKGVPGNPVIGDPGLLADELVRIETRDIDLGVIPHWSDTRLAHDHRFQGKWTNDVISAWGDPLDVISRIGRCKRIVTSSLHGLILADAFGVPRRFEPCRRMLLDSDEGNLFKFHDYAASVNVPFRVGEIQKADRNLIEDRKNELYDLYRHIGTSLGSGRHA